MVDVALWVVLLFIFSMFLSETETEGKNIFFYFFYFFMLPYYILLPEV